MNVFRHVLFWIITVVLLTLVFGSSYDNYSEPLFFVSMLLPVIVGTAYFFNHHLVPRYLFGRQTFKFALYSGYLLIASLYLETIIVMVAFIVLARYRYDYMIPLATDIPVLTAILYGVVFLYGFGTLAKQSLANQKTIRDLKEEKSKRTNIFLHVRTHRRTSRILRDDIEYLESLGDYVKIHTASSPVVTTKEKISKLETTLPDSFLRIHRSYIVNTDKIVAYGKDHVQLRNINLPISRTYKKNVIDALADRHQAVNKELMR